MPRVLSLHSFIIFLALHSTSASPVAHSSPRSLQANCTDRTNGFDSSCWAAGTGLGLSAWLTNWKATTPVCTESNQNGCCKPNEVWANCFTRLATNGLITEDCAVINKACASQPTYAEEPVAAVIAPEVYYIVHNIYFINDFFTSWYNALNGASLSALFVAQPIINTVDPKQQANFDLNNLLTALTAGLAFIPGIGEGVSAAAKVGVTVLVTALQQAPGVAKAIWPAGSDDTQNIQLANIDTELASVQQNFTTGVVNALATVMSDVPSFIAFAQDGAFSGQDQVSLPDDTTSLGSALNTYVLSTAMTANGMYGIVDPATTKSSVASRWSCTFDDTTNICAPKNFFAFFFSEVTNNAYGLQGPAPLLQEIVTNHWSTLEAVFDGAYNCTIKGGQGKPLDFFTSNNELDLSCVSQLKLCSCIVPCPFPLNNGECSVPSCGSCS